VEETMDKNNFELLAKYNKETNEKMNNIIKTLSEEEWNKQFSGYYKSIHELCSHIFIGDHTWLSRFKSINNFKNLTDAYFIKKYSFQEILFENIAEYLTKRAELDNIIIDFIDELTEDNLKKELKWTNLKGITLEKKLEVFLLHIFNHETHHRGMISLHLEMLGRENDYSSLYPYG
jgi:uncharacterized damage-inducible protein DinB